MTITTEQVRRLCAASGVDEIAALSALERQGGDLLEAMLELERQGSVPPPAGGGSYSTRQAASPAGGPLVPGAAQGAGGAEEARPEGLWGGLRELLGKARRNRMEVRRRGELVTAMPLLVLFLLLACFPQVTAPLLLIGWALGLRYRFAGPDLPPEGLLRGSRRRTAEALHRAAERIRRRSRDNDR